MTRPAKPELAPRPKAKRRTGTGRPKTDAKPVVVGPRASPKHRRATGNGAWRQKAEALEDELRELRRQKRATNDILRALSNSPTDLLSVLNAVANHAARLCDAKDIFILRVAGDVLENVAHSGKNPTAEMVTTFPILPGYAAGSAVLTRQVVHVRDLASSAGAQYPETQSLQVPRGVRTLLVVPLLRDGAAVGVIGVRRHEVRPFSAKQIELVRTLADEAVIALENTRLFKELEERNKSLTEALEQQTATSEILRVISSSPMDLQPILDAVAKSAARLCGHGDGAVILVEGDHFVVAAKSASVASPVGEHRPIRRDLVLGRALLDNAVIHIPDLQSASEEEFSGAVARGRELGYRAVLAVPMVREGKPIGVLWVSRTEATPFSDKQIDLVRTFADQAVIAIENVRLFRELEERNKSLTEALEQQTATSQILRVISSSPTDLQPVLDAVAQSAARLCDASDALIHRVEGDFIRTATQYGSLKKYSQDSFPIRRDIVAGRAIIDRRVVHVHDILAESGAEFATARAFQPETGQRTMLAAPMLREGNAIGVIVIRRTEVRPFTDKHIDLLKTFADQAVIAIENVRLFRELEERNKSLTESLEQQTATSEILRVISRSQRDVQPVFEAIAANAQKLCEGTFGGVWTFDGELIHLAAAVGFTPDGAEALRQSFPRRPGNTGSNDRAILKGAVVYIPDVLEDAEYGLRHLAREVGFRSMLSVPMLKEGKPIGTIGVSGAKPGMFSPRQIVMLETFADQAVIAIENVRLFKELEERNKSLTEALEQQTATSEILRVISQSQSDVQPVFDTIAENARKLCSAASGWVFTFDGEFINIAAANSASPEALETIHQVFPMRPARSVVVARAILTRTVVYVPDIRQDAEYPQHLAQATGFLSALSIPMLRDGSPIGAIGVAGPEPAMFSERQIAMLGTFADQAVIAIENTRLFQELQTRTRELAQSVEQLKALAEVSEAVNSTLDLQKVLETIVARAVQLSGTSGGAVYEFDDASSELRLRATHGLEPELVDVLLAKSVRIGEGASGRAAAERAPVEISDLRATSVYTAALGVVIERMGIRAILALPLMREDRVLGTLTVSRRSEGKFAPEVVSLLQTFAAQSALAIQNARLFREIEQKSHELEIASQHKSQFLANMSHELRTPLNAILGYTELIADQIYGPVPEKILDVLNRVEKSGRHLLGLINDVLDLSKIEAGQLVLSLADYSFSDIVQAVASAVGSLAAEKRLPLEVDVAPELPVGRGDERRITQVLLNLVGNAIKFTDAGEIAVRVTVREGMFVVSVADTGPGIREEDRQKIFEEFQQSDSSPTKTKGGTGLGLAIAKRIVEMHGGRIWVESTVGTGSTFFFSIPVRAEQQEGVA